MPIDNASLSSDPLQPVVGLPFVLTVKLNSVASTDIVVAVEKQRIVASSGGLELRPTGPKYFELDPKPIKIVAGARSGTSEPVAVKRDASAETGDPPVHFPEHLLFSAFIGEPSRGFACTIVPVSLPQDD